MATNDKYRLLVQALWRSQIYQNTYAFNWKGTGDPTHAQQLDLANDAKELWRPTQSNDLAYDEWRVSQLWGSGMTVVENECRREGGKIFQGVFTGTLAGGASGAAPAPPQAALVTTLVSGIAGRRKRGRTYGFGFLETAQDGGLWKTATLSGQSARWVTFLAEYGDGGTSTLWQLGVWSERVASGCVPNLSGHGHTQIDEPSPDTAFTPVNDVTLRAVVYTQRRRVLGVGR